MAGDARQVSEALADHQRLGRWTEMWVVVKNYGPLLGPLNGAVFY